MPIHFRCPGCERMLSIARRKAGSTVGCPKCGKTVPVPASAGVAVASDPHAGAKPYNEMPLFERNDFEALLNPAVKAAVKPKTDHAQVNVIPVPFPDLTAEASDEAEVMEVDGIVISRSRLTAIAIVVAVLLAMSFAVGYFLAAATATKKTAEADRLPLRMSSGNSIS